MKIHRASTKTVVSVAALLLLLGATIAVTQRLEPSVSRATVCVKDNGQLRMLTGGATTCDPSERLVQWVVDGEVTDIRAGQGLVGTREGGAINLALDPSVLETCGSCNGGKVFAGFNDGPGEIPMGELPNHDPQQIAKLDLPEGDYAIFAKMQLSNPNNDDDGVAVACRLTAGADSDGAFVVLENTKDEPGAFWGGASRQVMKLQVVHRFDTPGSVVLSCADGFTLFGINADGNAQFSHLKIIAMKASNISNVFLGGN